MRVRLCDENVENKEKEAEEEGSILILKPLQLIQSKFFLAQKCFTIQLTLLKSDPSIGLDHRCTALELVTGCT